MWAVHAIDPFTTLKKFSPVVQISGTKEAAKEDRRPALAERRSAQQLERDSLRQKSFETRRAASHPQLAYEDQIKGEPDNRPQPQTAHTPIRRGSHGNLIETTICKETEKDSDDGGFLKRNGAKEKQLEEVQSTPQKSAIETAGYSVSSNYQSVDQSQDVYQGQTSDVKVTEALTGTPRKKLEGEIGKIEGVYNVGQRSKTETEDARNLRKHNIGSGASSDYDKAGQSSSNADSGRGSAAYSSGRRPGGIDMNSENCDTYQMQGSNYRDLHTSGKFNIHIIQALIRGRID